MAMNCGVCRDARWVCEDHPDRAWPNGCDCGGAGTPCPACNNPRDEKPELPDGYQSFIAVRQRPLPDPPRCRGILIEEGVYTGCAYGYGDVAPFTPPCDCPTCNGSGFENGYAPN